MFLKKHIFRIRRKKDNKLHISNHLINIKMLSTKMIHPRKPLSSMSKHPNTDNHQMQQGNICGQIKRMQKDILMDAPFLNKDTPMGVLCRSKDTLMAVLFLNKKCPVNTSGNQIQEIEEIIITSSMKTMSYQMREMIQDKTHGMISQKRVHKSTKNIGNRRSMITVDHMRMILRISLLVATRTTLITILIKRNQLKLFQYQKDPPKGVDRMMLIHNKSVINNIIWNNQDNLMH